MKKVVIVGGGAAGLTSAIFASKNKNLNVYILERTSECGKKILMSGDDYSTKSKKTNIKKIFSLFSLDSIYKWLTNDIKLKLVGDEETNKWFPESNSAKQVRDQLLNKALSQGVVVNCNTKVIDITSIKSDKFKIITESEEIVCDYLILSTGGLSYPKIGTDGIGHSIVSKLGISVSPLFPALVPLVGTHPGNQMLAGISLCVSIIVREGDKNTGQIIARSKREGFLFTHSGFSGPSILDISHYAVHYFQNPEKVKKVFYLVSWKDDMNSHDWNILLQRQSNQLLSTVIRNEGLPHRLADALCEELNLSNTTLATLTKLQRENIINSLTNYCLNITGNKGYNMAEVTGGGVLLDEIKLTTMGSKKFKNLYLCGEILDCFGRIGGFNFYWAFVTGSIAGNLKE